MKGGVGRIGADGAAVWSLCWAISRRFGPGQSVPV